MSSLENVYVPNHMKFFISATAGVASTVVCFPLDLVKIRLQVLGEGTTARSNMIVQAIQVFKKYGFLGFYEGLSASCFRQFIYTGLRFAVFQAMLDSLKQNGYSTGFVPKVVCSTVSGAIGALAGLPGDVCMTRMITEPTLPEAKKRGYRHIFHCLYKIYMTEGFKMLYKGLTPTVTRACLLNIGQLTSYAEAREFLMRHGWTGEENTCHFITSMFSAVVSCIVSLPPDIARIRMQYALKGGDTTQEYKGFIDSLVKVVKKEGFFALWKGFWPLMVRNGPQFFVVFFVYEHLTYAYKRSVLATSK